MLASLRSALAGALLFATSSLLVLACGDDERYPPPPLLPATTGSFAAAAGSVAATTGSGGDQGDDYYCSCIAAFELNWMSDQGCVHCFNLQQEFPSDPCYALSSACKGDTQCLGIIDCLYNTCMYDADCTQNCILPFDKDEGHKIFRDILTCSCSQCQPMCTHPDISTCGGSGGAGGSGGLGGSGGAGGMGRP